MWISTPSKPPRRAISALVAHASMKSAMSVRLIARVA
jgi:hypothetical protein